MVCCFYYFLASDINYKLFVAGTKESDKIIYEPDNFHDCMVDVSEQIENKYDNYH